MDRAVVEVTWETARNWIRYIFFTFFLSLLAPTGAQEVILSVCVYLSVIFLKSSLNLHDFGSDLQTIFKLSNLAICGRITPDKN